MRLENRPYGGWVEIKKCPKLNKNVVVLGHAISQPGTGRCENPAYRFLGRSGIRLDKLAMPSGVLQSYRCGTRSVCATLMP
jgi:hypothetical protein